MTVDHTGVSAHREVLGNATWGQIESTRQLAGRAWCVQRRQDGRTAIADEGGERLGGCLGRLPEYRAPACGIDERGLPWALVDDRDHWPNEHAGNEQEPLAVQVQRSVPGLVQHEPIIGQPNL